MSVIFHWPERWCTVTTQDGTLYHGAFVTRVSDGREGVYHMTSNTFIPGIPVERVGMRAAVGQWALPILYRHMNDADTDARTIFESVLVILSEHEDPRGDQQTLDVALAAIERARSRFDACSFSGFPSVSLVGIRSTVEA